LERILITLRSHGVEFASWNRMDPIRSLIGGAVGALALTAVHQAAQKTIDRAPRVDVLGRRAIAKPLRAMGVQPPRGDRLQQAALAGDLVSNSSYYALLGLSRPQNLWQNACLLGLAAGIGAVALPPVLGLGSKPTARTPATAGMTIAWYTLGALAAAATLQALDDR
jgi:hypothetical protein